MRLTGAQRKLLVDTIVERLPEGDALRELENLLALSEIPRRMRIRRPQDPVSFALAIVQHCEAYGSDSRGDAVEALLTVVVKELGGWTPEEVERLSRAIAPQTVPAPAAVGAGLPTTQAAKHVFVSFNSRERALVCSLVEKLAENRVNVWLDQLRLSAGTPFASSIDRAIETAVAALVVIGASGMGPWQELETRALLRHHVERKLTLCPVVLAGAPDRPPWPGFLNDLQITDLRRGEAALSQLAGVLRAVAPAPA